ncbi:epoxyqueuosine reductase [Bathymodiolus platifrons methanotrophic gill symbiont]|uniref:tRNA epoxyqueuosine(34) reductase QueG n=1 Tax=Bathymodiolus platifrons methanotrophic gill symbiont TaxID=113268 RepID=UPI0011CCD83D|nr:tRNA epoxyqueuosine(34) reductase QueG [Bathymodiolus platifrons methanotrophic gill symbiont]TXL01927.1 tRNA epoxyqueuosine(34) reductase QueG [Methylococcaceae bacterium HT1]TXL17022.1 tRNA epoxyqueuosine(34) reductase QueG [Methylococcaceae bacterium HT3]TXL22107.1 tRNA epoxyqueuosine(34) reductase QueG [Methylococcaceae bacterium HT2]GFO74292.1 epoxyqueuosine reductase [Bathymodiolus platifrons methanotrophic gill symbiont]
MDMTMNELSRQIKQWGNELGFQQVGISDTDLQKAEQRLHEWLAKGYHADMDYMHKHGLKRSRPALLQPETVSIISVRMDYLPEPHEAMETTLNNPIAGFISRYALGRDYHKVLRKPLQKLAKRIEQEVGVFGYRAFVDSAPVLEKAIAEKAGLGWIGKHSNIINKKAGSWFFLGEIYTSLPLVPDSPSSNHCGLCTSCLDICPTQAIVTPYQVDARRCISYLTIELKGSIPEDLRPLMGNRIYGCDDCQLICPWNRFARISKETDFSPRHNLNAQHLIELFNWTEEEFLHKTEGSAIRRIGHQQWLRNIAVALGNAPANTTIRQALHLKVNHKDELVREHVAWALAQSS